ncbi:MAG: ATP-binding cassette domain-containing protein [Candidatus Manganitrophus sp.]|nr:ATP-binding cassette domain-containing protein [Candidatus Manganitrophus sp.]
MNHPSPMLKVTDLKTWFHSDAGIVRAVDGISFDICRGETFALLGESGCGKSMTALSLMRLLPEPAGRIVSGEALLNGQDLLQAAGGGDAPPARQPHLDDLPGADDQPQPGDHRRRPDRRGAAASLLP